MHNHPPEKDYRHDIDGLRAIAVFAVILFHLGYLPPGYLGVDVFFVISGYLITGIIYPKVVAGNFSMIDFYLRRIRRILPLASTICLLALLIGILKMLPDDLENLAQSVIATNLFSNNILEFLKRLDYWGVVNEYKPLMHTWSLGVEEQFYFVYPLLLVMLRNRRWSITLPALYTITLLSLGLFLAPGFEVMSKFYLPVFRFWELAVGGIAAVQLGGRTLRSGWSPVFIIALSFLLLGTGRSLPNIVSLPLAVFLTVGVLCVSNTENRVSNLLLCNPVSVFLGKISYSLYMWHQLVFSFARYFWRQEFGIVDSAALITLVIALSVLSYWFIEQPFRNKKRVATPWMLTYVCGIVLASSLASIHVVRLSGVLKDVPELEVYRATAVYGQHSKYNGKIYFSDKPFASKENLKVLVTGDSFGRDWANVLLESKYASNIEISYICWVDRHPDVKTRMNEADIIFSSRPDIEQMKALEFPMDKVWAVGTKNFGSNTGYFYNHRGKDYYKQRTHLQKGVLAANERLKSEWGDRFIDLIGPIIDANQTVPVFTPEGKFISQDTNHLTRAGAKYYAQLLDGTLHRLIGNPKAPH